MTKKVKAPREGARNIFGVEKKLPREELVAEIKVLKANANSLKTELDELKCKANASEAEIDALKAENDALKTENEALKQSIQSQPWYEGIKDWAKTPPTLCA